MTNAETLTANAKKLFYTVAAFALVAVLLLQPDTAHAGAGGVEFDSVWSTLKDWIQGTLGKIIAGSMILVGIIGGIARQSLMAFALGIGGGMGLSYSPAVVESIMTATLEKSHHYAPMLGNSAGVIDVVGHFTL